VRPPSSLSRSASKGWTVKQPVMKCSVRRPFPLSHSQEVGIAARTSSRRVGCAHALCADRSGGGGTGAPLLWPAIPSRESYIALLDAFEAVYVKRKNPASKHAGITFATSAANPQAFARPMRSQNRITSSSETDRGAKLLLKPSEKWERPGSVARCLLVAIRDEEVESSKLDQVLAPFWPTLWGLAARGHSLRHERQPVRLVSPNEMIFATDYLAERWSPMI